MAKLDEDEIMRSLKQSLSEQVQDEMGQRGAGKRGAASNKKKKKKHGGRKAFFITILILCCCGGILVFTPIGQKLLIHIATEYAYSRINYQKNSSLENEEELTKGPNIDANKMSEAFRNAKQEEYCTNILLLGVEAIGAGTEQGHTDAIMIATINEKEGTMKLTSLMRDTWVSIPGYGDDRINSVYRKGGIDLLYETIALNYNIQLDGHALVDFEDFENVIDALGGIEIELTKGEAQYLNSTNYISNVSERHVVEGVQTMTGNQALGYSRVRKRATLDGSTNDQGRTFRQRQVISAIFEKVKTSSPTELVGLMNTVLPLIETDINKSNCKAYMSSAMEIGLQNLNLEQLRIPADNLFTTPTINKKSVVLPEWPANIEIMQKFIFATGEETTAPDGTEEIEPIEQ